MGTPVCAPILPTADPIETVRTLLRHDIAAILHKNLPALKLVAEDKVYDKVMDDPILLDQGFRLLRTKPELFKEVVRTRERTLPSSDTDPLWCGRTLADAVALVVRACARRYFRRRLKAPKLTLAPAKPPLLFQIGLALGLVDPPRQPKRKAQPTPGEKLYLAIRDFLLYDWQVPLIPAYVALSPATVVGLGPRILEFRDPLKLQLLADENIGHALVEGKTPLLLSDAGKMINSDNIDAEMLWSVCQKMRLGALFPNFNATEMRKAVAMIAATSPVALKAFLPVLGDDIRKFTLYLFTTYACFGPTRYRQVLGAHAQGWVIEAMAKRAKREPALSGTHEEMKATIETWLNSAVAALDQSDKDRAEAYQSLDRVK
ncbi:hypothetical protein [Magnetospirillum moscoviense]|uniref:Uncharacterized protein n=1 Tax=Magnetospirillum moscoviense TaxID=1437059 RepID=A0A178M4U5_9PROT|nr:hypothetical protein [Magnetospirillum moscoviense]OAN43761.1 hypothetical protein A6A05_05300 [Magnetospirillum moscoviense]